MWRQVQTGDDRSSSVFLLYQVQGNLSPHTTMFCYILSFFFKVRRHSLTYWDLDVSSFWRSVSSTHLIGILIKLGQNHTWRDSYRSYTLCDPRGQKFIFTKNVSTPLYYSWLSCHSYTWSSLTLSFKITNMNLTWGHLRSLRSINGVKFWTILNGKSNTAKVLVGVKHQNVSTVTSSPDLWLRGQRSKKVKTQTMWNDMC